MSSQKSRADVSLSIECVPSQVARVLALAAHGVASRAPLPLVTAVETAAHRRTSSHYEVFKTASLDAHPDCNPSLTAALEFVALTNAFEVQGVMSSQTNG